MVVYWIMFIYTMVFAIVIETENKQNDCLKLNQNENTAIRTVGIVGGLITFFAIILFTSIRGYVADTTSYIAAFQNETRTLADIPALFQDFFNVKGPLWITIQIVVKNYIYDDVTVMFTIIAAFQGFAVAKTFSMYSEYFTFSAYLFVSGYSFFWMLNGTRQFTAVCVLLLASKYLFNKNIKIYLLWVLLAGCFHTTALLFIIIAFVVQGKPFNRRVVVTIVLALVSVVFIDSFTHILDSVLEDTLYNGVAAEVNEGGMSPFVTLINLAPVILVWWRRKSILSVDRPRYIDVIINLSCINVGICLIANFTSGITFGRLPIYFSIYNCILLPWVIEKIFTGVDKTLVRATCIIFYMMYFLYKGYGSSMGGGEYSSLYWKFIYENFSIKLF